MSVAFHKLTSERVFIGGRAEALWMLTHLPHDEINDSYTKFYIDEDNIKAAVEDAKVNVKDGVLPSEFEDGSSGTDEEEMLEDYERITREFPKVLSGMLAELPKDKQAPKAPPYLEIEIGW